MVSGRRARCDLCCPRLARRAALVWLSLLQRRSDQTGLCLKVRPAWPARSVIWDCLWRVPWAQTTVTPFCPVLLPRDSAAIRMCACAFNGLYSPGPLHVGASGPLWGLNTTPVWSLVAYMGLGRALCVLFKNRFFAFFCPGDHFEGGVWASI